MKTKKVQFSPVKVIHPLECIRDSNEAVLEAALGFESWFRKRCGIAVLIDNLPRTVVSPSNRAPKLDIKGLRETICAKSGSHIPYMLRLPPTSRRRKLCEVGKKRRKIRMNMTVRVDEKIRNTGVTDAMTTTLEVHAMTR